jgi:formate dehydrogenase major subunit
MGRRTVDQIGLPYHWGAIGLSRGDSTNELIAFVADPNVSIQESKALTGNIEPGRKSRQRRAATTGPLARDRGQDPSAPRDLPVVGERPKGRHGLEAPKTKEGEQA